MNAPWTGGQSPGAQRFSVDGDHTIAGPDAQPRISFPFDGDSHAPTVDCVTFVPSVPNGTQGIYGTLPPDPAQTNACGDTFIIEQEFTIAGDYFEPLAMNTPYDASYAPDYVGNIDLNLAILVAESPTTDIGNGIVRWTRTYAVIPPPRNDYETMPFTFPGIANTLNWQNDEDFTGFVELSDGRPPIAKTVAVRVQHDFFVIPDGGAFSPDFGDPSSPFYIIPEFIVFGNFTWQQMQTVADAYENAAGDWTGLNGDPASAPFNETSPPKSSDVITGYLDMIGLEICVKQSEIRRWRGNIYERTTVFAMAQ